MQVYKVKVNTARRFLRKRRGGASYISGILYLFVRWILRPLFDLKSPHFGTLWTIIGVLGWPIWFADDWILEHEFKHPWMPKFVAAYHQKIGMIMVVFGELFRKWFETYNQSVQQKRIDKAHGIINQLEKKTIEAVMQFETRAELMQDRILQMSTGGNSYCYFLPTIKDDILILNPVFAGKDPLHNVEIKQFGEILNSINTQPVISTKNKITAVPNLITGQILPEAKFNTLYYDNFASSQYCYKISPLDSDKEFINIGIYINARNGTIKQNIILKQKSGNKWQINFVVNRNGIRRNLDPHQQITEPYTLYKERIIKGSTEEKIVNLKTYPELNESFQGKFSYNITIDKDTGKWTQKRAQW